MAGKKVGSDGQIRKTTAEWASDTANYPEGMRLMDTDTGTVRVSKGTTYALAWTPTTGSGAAWGEITGTISDQTDLQYYLALVSDLNIAVSSLIAEKGKADVWQFSTDTTDSDPLSGNIKFNNATIASVTEIYVDDNDQSAQSRAAWVATWSGVLNFTTLWDYTTLGSPVQNNLPITFTISSVTDASGYTKIGVTYVSGALPANGASLRVSLSPLAP